MSDDDAHIKIFREHHGLLFGIAYRMLGSVMDAESAAPAAALAFTVAALLA